MKKLLIILTTVCFPLIASISFGDTITLKNSQKINGNIVEENEKEVVIDIVIGGELVGGKMEIRKDEIDNIHSDGAHKWLMKKALTYEEKAIDRQRTIERFQKRREALDEIKQERKAEIRKHQQRLNKIDNDRKLKKEQQEEFPVIKANEVAKANLKIFYELGCFSGYVVFYNETGKQCAVKGNHSFPAKLYTGKPRHIVTFQQIKKEFQISPQGFRNLTLRNGSRIYAYPIESFLVQDLNAKRVIFQFEWESIRAQDTAYIID